VSVLAGQLSPLGSATRRQAAAWTPDLLGTLGLWLDAADTGTVTIDGGAVSQWGDKSGNGHHLSQSTPGMRPTLVSDDGYPAIQFTGNGWLKNATYAPASAFTVFFALKPGSLTGTFHALFNFKAATVRELLHCDLGGYADITMTANGSNAFGADQPSFAGSNRLLGMAWDAVNNTSANFDLRVGGSALTVGGSGPVGYEAETGFALGARAVQGLGFYSGLMREVVVCESDLADADKELVEGYLAHKWGLTADLPSGHPYKTDPPEAP
jgi:hypothetical protein